MLLIGISKFFGIQIVGWGIDQSESLANDLHEATMPVTSKLTCILYDPIFYSNILANDKKFCAGLSNGELKISYF